MPHNGKTISLGRIIWKVLKNPLADKLSYEEAAEFATEFIRLVGAPLVFIDEVKTLKLNSYKALLPNNLLNVKTIRYSNDKCFDTNSCLDNIKVLRYASNSFHTVEKNDTNYDNDNEYTYIIQKNILQTSIETGYVQISYKSLAVDEEGFPLIPDDERFKFGLEYFILFRYLEPMWIIGKIPDKVFSYIEQKKHWYTGSANNSIQMPTPDQMETIMNGINRIVIDTQMHQKAFRNYGVKEKIQRYN